MKRTIAMVMSAVMVLITPASALADEWSDIIIEENDYDTNEDELIIEEEDPSQDTKTGDLIMIEEPETFAENEFSEEDSVSDVQEVSEENEVILEIEEIEEIDASEIPEELQDEEDEGLQTFSVEVGNTVTDVSDPSSEVTYNTGSQDYGYSSYHSSPVSSYLVDVSGGFMRVEYTGSQIAVEYYNSNLTLTSKKYIAMELPLFGGFYAGGNAYYLVYGQENLSENNSAEVIRIVKYSTDWVREDSVSLCGANTTIPFDAGSLRMAECGGYLYIRTSHEMYTSSDGKNHQANLMIEVEEATMDITDTCYSVWDVSAGYVSHSFNQFIIIDDENNLVAVDHGDAHPRSAVLMRYTNKAGENSFFGNVVPNNDYVNLLTFSSSDNNYTGASLGGLEYSGSAYLTAGNSVVQDENWRIHSGWNIFVAVTSRSDLSTTVKWITDYDTDGDVRVSTPQMVKLGTDSFLLLWTVKEADDDSVSTSSRTKLCYVFLDGNGNPTSEIYTVDGQLSDCKPIVSGGSVYWYVTGDANSYTKRATSPYFYKISADETFSHTETLEEPVITSIESVAGGIQVSWEEVPGAEGYYVYRSGTCVATVDGGTTSAIVSGTSGYTYSIWVEAYSGGDKSLVQTKQAFYYLKTPTIYLSTSDSGIEVEWSSISGAEGYMIYRKEGDEEYQLVQTTSETTWLDTDVSNATTYSYQARAYIGDIISGFSKEKTITFLGGMELLSVENTAGGIQVTWTTMEGATDYRILFNEPGIDYFYYEMDVTAQSGSTQSSRIPGGYITSGVTYFIFVEAIVDDTTCGKTQEMTIRYLETPSITLTTTDHSIQVEWKAVGEAEGYWIYRKENEGEYELVQTLTGASWEDTSVSSGSKYTYQTCAFSGDTVSGVSVDKALVFLEPPTLQSLENVEDGVLVTWRISEGADYYYVYYKEDSASSYSRKLVDPVDGDMQSKVLSLEEGKTYDVYVIAVLDSYESAPSETLTIKVEKIEETEPESESESEAETETESDSDSESETETESESESESETEHESNDGSEQGSDSKNPDETNPDTEDKSETGESNQNAGDGSDNKNTDTTKDSESADTNGGSSEKSESVKNAEKSGNETSKNNADTAENKSSGNGGNNGSTQSSTSSLKKGSTYTSGNFQYKITALPASGTGTVTVIAPVKTSIKTAAIPAKVTIGGRSFKVTKIAAKAFKGCKKLKTVSIGKNVASIGNQAFSGCTKMTGISIKTGVTTIGKKAFYNCKNLKTITIKSKKLTSVGKNSFKGIKSNATIKVPKSKLKAYTKLLKGKGQGSKVKITS